MIKYNLAKPIEAVELREKYKKGLSSENPAVAPRDDGGVLPGSRLFFGEGMRAKCPHCQKGCVRCQEGFIEVSFGTGPLYTRACQNKTCGAQNGGFIVLPDMKKGPDGGPPEPSDSCVFCGSPTVWKLAGEVY